MTNWEWLEALANNSPDELQAWFDSEHVETPNATSHGDTAALEAKSSDDSREKLEADVYRAADDMDRFYCGERFIDTRKIIGWLDRQAAITERECCKYIDGAGCDGPEVVHGLNGRIAELQEQVDKYKELNEYNALQYELASEDCDKLQAQVDELKAEHERIVQELVDANTRQCERTNELTAERDNLEADCKDWMKHAMAAENVCHETKQEREQYRKLFGMALDWAHEITMLESSIDEGMA